MRVLVDAWNVLHQEGILPPGLAGIDLVGLGRLMRATRWGRIHTTLACDGKPRPRPEGLPEAIHVLWSGHLREADDIMEGLIARSTTPRRLVVVSSDRRLRKAARRRRCRWLSSEDFLRTILDDLAAGDRGAAPPARPSGGASAWMARFGVTADEVAAIEAEADQADLDALLGAADPATEPDRTGGERPPRAEMPSQATGPAEGFPESVLQQARRIAGSE